MDKNIDLAIAKEDNTIKEVMEIIDRGGFRVAFVVDGAKKILGVVTDGDVRRALLGGRDFGANIGQIMNKEPITAPQSASVAALMNLMLKYNIQQIPLIDGDGAIINIALLSELKTIPLSNPDITKKEIELLNKVLTTPILSIGPKVKEFEKKIADYVGVKYAVAVNSGTSGLHLCVRSLGIKDGDEVITSPFSFVASANCVLFERANPVFVDIDPNTLCIDPSKIEEKITKKTKAILLVDIFGHPCDMDPIMEIAKKYNLRVIEDACEAIGAEYKGKKAGSFGDCGVLAFYPNKQITTAEGGMILTNNENIARLCRSMRNQGRDDDGAWLTCTRLGYNYRMSELSGALGVGQMERIEEILGKRDKVARLYNKKLKVLKGILTPYVSTDAKISWFVYVIRLDDPSKRDFIIKQMEVRGITCRNYLPSIHLQPFYANLFGYQRNSFPISEKTSDSTIALPFYSNLMESDIDYVCANLADVMEKI